MSVALNRAFAALAGRGVASHPTFCTCRLCRSERAHRVALVTDHDVQMRAIAMQARRVGRTFTIGGAP